MSLLDNAPAKDRSIIVGIRDYPDPSFGRLRGPVNDAKQFYDWIRSPEGGRLSEGQVTLIVSEYDDPEETPPQIRNRPIPAHTSAAQPAWDKVDRVFRELREECRGGPIGRRLYLYFSGHGVSIRRGHCGIYCADATRAETRYFACTAQVDWLIEAGAFTEILMFADCCRNRMRTGTDLPFAQPIMGNPRKVKAVFLMAAQDGLGAKEKQIEGKAHGVFTWALLKGLNGAAADARGRITAQRLVTYVATSMPNYLSPEELDDPEVSTYPEPIFHPPWPPLDFEIATARRKPDGWIDRARLFVSPRPIPFKTTIRTGEFAGTPLEIRGPEFDTVAESTDAAPDPWTVSLEAGLYLIRNSRTQGNLQPAFEVPHPEEIRVSP